MIKLQSHYLTRVYNPRQFKVIVRNTLEIAKQVDEKSKYDTIAFTGQSGSALAYILAHSLNKKMICVRKDSDNSHYFTDSGNNFEGYVNAKKYIIVDDFICSGESIDKIVQTVQAKIPKAKCVGILLYSRRTEETSIGGYNGIPTYATRK